MEDIQVIVVDEGLEIESIELEELLKGKDGKDGKDGYTPIKGIDYFDGKDGAEGPQGPRGERGERGEQGIQGIQGIQGPRGLQGEKGERGERGATGSQGIQGPQGMRGEKGDRGERGSQGPIGPTGPAGSTGPKGDKGEPGPTYTAGEGIDITNNIISATSGDLSEYVKKTELESNKNIYVKEGLVDNDIELTDEEKLKIENWLGLSETYLTNYNETPYQVNSEYNPAHKKYVDGEITKIDERIDEIELFKFPNVTIFGSPAINQGQVSNFSRANYLEFPFLVDFKQRAFEINFAFTTGTDIDTQQNILDSDFGLAFAIRNKHLIMALSFNGSSWATEQVGSLTLQPQISYRIKITWNGLLYKVQYSIDGGKTYIDDITFGATQTPYPKQMYIGVGKLANNFFKGIINLNYANVKIANELIWQGMDDVGLATRLAIDLGNIDEAGIEKIKEIARPTENYLNKDYTGINELKGKIQIGDYTSNITNAILHIRKVSGSITGKSVNGACYSVNGDGTASLQHKTYNDDGTGAKNSAVLRMSNQGIQFAINTGTGSTPTEDMYKELATVEYVNNLITNTLGGSY